MLAFGRWLRRLSRRSFLKGTTAGVFGSALVCRARGLSPQETPEVYQSALGVQLEPVEPLAEAVSRTWIGPSYWANRLQDWRLHEGRIECLMGRSGDEVRTVAVLTREIVHGRASAHLGVRTGVIDDAGRGGFCGFLVGAGGGELDYRAAALAQKASGTGGGILCTYESDGQVRFREHTDEEEPLAFAELPADDRTPAGPADGSITEGEILLRLDMNPQPDGRFELKLTAWDQPGGRFLSGATRRNVSEEEIAGGIALVSSPYPYVPGPRFWFRDVQTAGRKIAKHPERSFGPILGTLFSLNRNVLKMSAQFSPLGEQDPQTAQFQYRQRGGSWQEGPIAALAPGYVATFRLTNWDPASNWEYRIVYPHGSPRPHEYSGRISRDPGESRPLRIGLFSCTICSARSLEGGSGTAELPRAEPLGRYTHKSIYFPHNVLVKNAGSHQPDLLVFAGDQLYEGNPTRKDMGLSPTLDYLYKWYLWVWSFREMTRNTPAVILTDDHDVYHGNLWGNGGRLAPERDQNRGGYRCQGEFVNLVQRTQCGHNPDPYDPTPVLQGIDVYYGSFRYGGVSFAILEDRKFKTAPIQGADLDVHEAALLGERQEKFLADWAGERNGVTAKICLTQTVFACVQTSPQGRPLLDFDSNGYPKLARDRALRLLREAPALVLAGDQHLATVVRHGIDTFTDGVLQFTGPANGTSWQRWFEPAEPLPHALDTPYTGDFTDAFGNKLRVLAVANPKISFEYYRRYRTGRGQGLGDRRLKSEGYGIVRVDPGRREFLLECWPWDVDPAAPGAKQFPGWPYRVSFDEL